MKSWIAGVFITGKAYIIFITLKMVQGGLSYGIDRDILADEIEGMLRDRNLEQVREQVSHKGTKFPSKYARQESKPANMTRFGGDHLPLLGLLAGLTCS